MNNAIHSNSSKTVNAIAFMIGIYAAIGTCAASDASSKYTFDYAIKGQATVSPIQVFDNGGDTYFQFRQDRPIPAIFAVTQCGTKVLLGSEQQGAYTVIAGRYKNLSLQMGEKSATVDYTGKVQFALEESLPIEECDSATKYAQGPTAIRAFTAVRPTFGDDREAIRKQKIEQARANSNSATRVYQEGAWRVTAQPIEQPLVKQPSGTAPTRSQSGASTLALAGPQVVSSPQPQTQLLNPSPAQPMAQTQEQARMEAEARLQANLGARARAQSKLGLSAAQSGSVQSNTLPVVINSNPVVVSSESHPNSVSSETVPDQITSWEIRAGESVKRSLDDWRKRAGWDMVWQYDGDFIAQAGATFNGDFQSAVKSLVAAMPESINMKIELASNKLVYVTKGVN
jgi:hypothetical protein